MVLAAKRRYYTSMKPYTYARAASVFSVLLLAFCLSPVTAQDGAEAAVFAPYPSRLRVGVRDDKVLISWEDSVDLSLGYVIYRHRNEPSAENFAEAIMIGDAEAGAESFEYAPPDDSPYYYIVLGRSESGVYEVFIPLRNVSLVGIAAPGAPSLASGSGTGAQSAAPSSAASAPAAGQATVAAQSDVSSLSPVTELSASIDGDSIIVGFKASPDAGRLIVYRGTSPFSQNAAILDAVVAALVEPSEASFRDYPVPGIPYFYAILPERELLGGSIRIVPGQNATQSALSIPAGSYRVGLPTVSASSRSAPLPYLILTRTLSDAHPVILEELAPSPKALSADTQKAVNALLAAAGSPARAERPMVTIFPEDLRSSGGEDFALRSIISDLFSRGSYAKAAEQLTLYLSLPRSATASAKARFYRAQALALSASYQEAFFDFLRAEESYYLQCQPWMDYVLAQLGKR
jgi:hypothetical protein